MLDREERIMARRKEQGPPVAGMVDWRERPQGGRMTIRLSETRRQSLAPFRSAGGQPSAGRALPQLAWTNSSHCRDSTVPTSLRPFRPQRTRRRPLARSTPSAPQPGLRPPLSKARLQRGRPSKLGAARAVGASRCASTCRSQSLRHHRQCSSGEKDWSPRQRRQCLAPQAGRPAHEARYDESAACARAPLGYSVSSNAIQ